MDIFCNRSSICERYLTFLTLVQFAKSKRQLSTDSRCVGWVGGLGVGVCVFVIVCVCVGRVREIERDRGGGRERGGEGTERKIRVSGERVRGEGD